jgi:hypothetical protein
MRVGLASFTLTFYENKIVTIHNFLMEQESGLIRGINPKSSSL